MKDLYFFITIIRRADHEEYEQFFRENKIAHVYSVNCNGTVHEKYLDLLGIERTEKTMLITVVTDDTLKTLTERLIFDMRINLPDRGVAMALPIASIGGTRALEYFTDGQIRTEITEENEMQSDFELIIAICEKGYTEVVMDAAREAGAGGGTSIKAKGTGAKHAEKFFGISIAEEKEIIMIVSDVAKKKDIMRAIMQKAGIDSEAHTLVLSLPVSHTAGFRFGGVETIGKDTDL